MTIVRLTLLEASILFGLLVFGYEIAVSFGRKWAVSVIPNPRHNLYHLGIVDTTSVTTRKERMMRLLQSSHTTTILRNTSFGLIADALLHPTLLAHPKPHHIVILTNSTDENRLEFYVTSALEHKSVTMISIWNLKQQQTPCETIISSRQNVQLIEHRISSLPHMSNCNSKSNRNLQEVAEEKDGNVEDSPIDILFVDGTVELSIEELTNYIHQSSLDETTNFTLLVELKNRSIIPHWVQALTDWDSMTDFSIRLPLPPPRAKQLRNYIVAFPDSRSESFWHLNEAEWNRRLVDKLRDSSKSFALDSTIMSQFAFPSKQSEVEFCRTNSAHVACESGGSGFDPSKHNTPADALFVERSLQGKHAGRGVFSSMDIPPDSYIGIDVAELRLPWTSTQLIYKFTEVDHDIHEFAHEQLFAYFDGYGFIRDVWVRFVSCLVLSFQ